MQQPEMMLGRRSGTCSKVRACKAKWLTCAHGLHDLLGLKTALLTYGCFFAAAAGSQLSTPAALIAWGCSLTNCFSGVLNGTALSTWAGAAPCGTPAWTGVTCTGTGAAAVPTAIALRSMSLNGSLSCFQGNVSSLLSIDVSVNAIGGSIPGCLVANLTALTLLNLAQNKLVGTLPLELPPSSKKLRLAVYDNLLEGTVPTTYSAFTWLAIAYNSGLVGALPANITGSMLQGWTGSAFAACASAAAPTNTGCLFGTSIGLDRNLTDILGDLARALDPGNTTLRSWTNATLRQPCPPYTGQRSTQPGYGRWLPGLFQPSSVGAATGTTYCQDYGNTPSAPFVFLTSSAMSALANPTGSSSSPGTTLPQNSALTGGISCLCASGLGLSGTLPTELRELRTTTNFVLSRNLLTGSLPAPWGQNVSWANFATPTPGFDAALMLDLGQNALSSTLPATVGSLGSSVGLGLYDNSFTGTVPASYTSLNWVALSYNPGLVGALPAGFTSAKLFAWTSYRAAYYSWYYVYTAGAGITYGGPPSYSDSGGYGTGFLYGTSIGLDRPLASILLDIRTALDPSGAVLGSWNASQSQPCRPWTTSPGTIGQNALLPGYGGGWRYVSTASSVTGSADYCQVWRDRIAAAARVAARAASYALRLQDWHGSNQNVALTPTTTIVNTAQTGGIAGLWLSGLGLNGSLPVALQDLLTVRLVTLSKNSLTGSIPGLWCDAVRAHRPRQALSLTFICVAQGSQRDVDQLRAFVRLHLAAVHRVQPGCGGAGSGAELADGSAERHPGIAEQRREHRAGAVRQLADQHHSGDFYRLLVDRGGVQPRAVRRHSDRAGDEHAKQAAGLVHVWHRRLLFVCLGGEPCLQRDNRKHVPAGADVLDWPVVWHVDWAGSAARLDSAGLEGGA